MTPPLPSIQNPAYAVAKLKELLSAFEALDYTQSIPEDFATSRKLVQRLQAILKSVYGADSPYPSTINLQFRYPRAKQANAVSYFAGDKNRAVTLLSEIIDEIHLQYPNLPQQHEPESAISAPADLSNSVARFKRDYPDPSKVAFIMMSFAVSSLHQMIVDGIKETLALQGITGVRADDKMYHPDLYPNILAYMQGCGLGVAVFETLQDKPFNPNVAFEVGYMLALQKPVCIFKDEALPTLQVDLIGKLYQPIARQDIRGSISRHLSKWLQDVR